MANSADPDQLASSEANWSGSTLFVKQGISGFSRTRVKQSLVCHMASYHKMIMWLWLWQFCWYGSLFKTGNTVTTRNITRSPGWNRHCISADAIAIFLQYCPTATKKSVCVCVNVCVCVWGGGGGGRGGRDRVENHWLIKFCCLHNTLFLHTTEYIKMQCPFLTVRQSVCLMIQFADTNSHTKWQTVQIQISWLLRSQLIWIYPVCKARHIQVQQDQD